MRGGGDLAAGPPRRVPDAGGGAAPLATLAGFSAAALQYAGALKSLPGVAALPFDLTAAAAALLLPTALLLLLARRWWLHAALAPPLLGALGLVLWLVLAGSWSASRSVLAEKLPQAVLLGPAMLAAGALVGADAPTLRRFCGGVLAAGLLVGALVAWGVAADRVVLGGEPGADPARVRVQYQLAGLAVAAAAGLAAVRAAEAWGHGRAAAALGWQAVAAALAVAVLVPGGRLALVGLVLGVALAPALLLWLRGRRGGALAWALGCAALAAAGLALLLDAAPRWAEGLRTLERLFGDPAATTPARVVLWGEALRWGGLAAPLGLGTGGFTIAAGFGEDRGFYPHNHALEALAEGGLPGLALWLLAFGGGVVLALRRAAFVAPGRAARVAALTLPVALTAMVSTDLGNRMVWFALGLLLSLGVEARPRRERGGDGADV